MTDCKMWGLRSLASIAAGIALSAGALAADGDMNLETQGIFWAGGEVVNRTQPELASNKILKNPLYVEYFVPKGANRNSVPIVLTHTALSGVVWRTTPDGREGWAEYFVRRGHPVFVIDPPGTGRAGLDIDDINTTAKGQTPAVTADMIGRSDSSAWPRWNLGPQMGAVAQGSQTPSDETSVRHFLGAMIPGRGVSNATMDASFIAAMERINKMFGPAVFVGWSTAGGLGQRLVVAKPDLFRALVVVEGYNGQMPLPTAQNWFDYCPLNPATAVVDTLTSKKLPLLSINGQNGHAINTGRAKQVCGTLVEMVTKAGGNGTNIYLPDIGITGNSHMMFWDRNSDQIAKVMVDWIQRNAPAKK
jgi:pimeloyl-ACP methyl ester carboxylesterase